ncbi:MAG: B12-binding domain-containing radical SAM protein [Nitrospirae bacterium]|nr:B12-binding domain-containing radical SAM protein [Nitrospirota bacterium]MCL5976679.1 B12-binding domain-containing radical SAM protein [Nitrospirota bacterium]
MLNKVLLIRPQNVYNYNNYPPLSLISIGSKLKSAGYNVTVINCALEKDPLEAISRELKDTLLSGITLLTSEAPDAYRIIKYIKENSEVPVVVGGWHCTLFPEQMAAYELIDYVVAGEGEDHMLTIADALRAGERPESRVFEKRFIDIETLPMPDYDTDPVVERFVSNYLTDKLSEYVSQPMRWLPYESSRGCPSHCTFCINVVTDNTRYRKKSAEKVINEIDYIVRKYNLSHLKIIDDNFFVDIRRVRAICEGIINRGLDITWDGECRCDYFREGMLDDEMLNLCRKSGLIQLTLGIESGSPHTLKLMKKGITPEQAEFAVKKCNEHGIIARSSFMIEVPGETMADIKQTIQFINSLRKYPYFTCGIGTFRPYPKCELSDKLIQQGYLTEPRHFEEWCDRNLIDLYTSAEYKRPWQVDGDYSEKVSFYINMESAVRLGNYQIDGQTDRIKNNIFITLAGLRNRLMFYGLPFEKAMYKRFLTGFYKRRQDMERAGAYPLSRISKVREQA